MAFSRYRDSGSSRLPDSVVRRAHDSATDLTVPSADDRVLHGDLHHQNVLRRLPAAAEDTSAYGAPTGYDAQTSWVAIDPHGWFGDPAFDTAALVAQPTRTIAETPDPAQLTRRRAAILAEVTGSPRPHPGLGDRGSGHQRTRCPRTTISWPVRRCAWPRACWPDPEAGLAAPGRHLCDSAGWCRLCG